jgi:hypothetical protein
VVHDISGIATQAFPRTGKARPTLQGGRGCIKSANDFFGEARAEGVARIARLMFCRCSLNGTDGWILFLRDDNKVSSGEMKITTGTTSGK